MHSPNLNTRLNRLYPIAATVVFLLGLKSQEFWLLFIPFVLLYGYEAKETTPTTHETSKSCIFLVLFITIFGLGFKSLTYWLLFLPFFYVTDRYLPKKLNREETNLPKVEKEKSNRTKSKLRDLQVDYLKDLLKDLEVDYLKAFIERVGLSRFSALDLITKIPILEEKLEADNINVLMSVAKAELNEVEKTIWKDYEGLAPLKSALESLLAVVEELPKLHRLLEGKRVGGKRVILSYSELVDLLKIKHGEMSEAMIGPLRENLYNSIKKITFMLLAKAEHKKTKENVASAFATSIHTLRKIGPNTDVLDTVPNLLTDFLNRILKESKVIQDDLPQNEISDLLNKKMKEVEIDSFETELKSGIKPTMVTPSNLDTLSGADFESFLEKLFKGLGYSVVKTPLTGDQGADLIIEKGDERIAVQAKRYSGIVSNKAVQEVVAAINYYKCNRAIVVTTSTFTKNALKLAASNKVELWNSKKLKEIIGTLKHRVVTSASTSEDGRIENLLPENYKKGSPPRKLLTVRPQKGTDIQKIKTKCVFCEGEIEFSVDLRELASKGKADFEIECPLCGNTMTVNPEVATWRCQYCFEEFETKKEAENHEKVCSRRKNSELHRG